MGQDQFRGIASRPIVKQAQKIDPFWQDFFVCIASGLENVVGITSCKKIASHGSCGFPKSSVRILVSDSAMIGAGLN